MKLSKALRDPRAVEEGVWVSPVAESPEFRVRAKVRGPEYEKRIGNFRAQWVRLYGSRGAPQDVVQRALVDVTFEECITGIEGITDDDGAPVAVEEVRRLCATVEGAPLWLHILTALEMVDARRAADAEEAEGNSSPSSTGS